jgi:hypothetical protein
MKRARVGTGDFVAADHAFDAATANVVKVGEQVAQEVAVVGEDAQGVRVEGLELHVLGFWSKVESQKSDPTTFNFLIFDALMV